VSSRNQSSKHASGSLPIAYTLATVGANKLWDLLNSEPFVPALGALSGNQAMQMVRAGLKAVYCSGWQVHPPLASLKYMVSCCRMRPFSQFYPPSSSPPPSPHYKVK